MGAAARDRLIRSAGQRTVFDDRLRPFDGLLKEWVAEIPDRFPVRFITDQRLVMRSSDSHAFEPDFPIPEREREEIRHAVSEHSRQLGLRIAHALGRYAAASQREDRTFPQLVADAIARQQPVELEDLLHLLDQVAAKRDALELVGLAESDEQPLFDRSRLDSESVRTVIQTFAEVTLRKFAVVEELRGELELFTDFLNSRFLGKIAQTRAAQPPIDEDGLIFRLPDGSELKPASLSSGEQQMLVLAYEVLFGTPEGTLLLIDEPELSLHVGWQRTFVDDIAAMGQPRRINFLLATHSPTLIGGREELRRSLDPVVQ